MNASYSAADGDLTVELDQNDGVIRVKAVSTFDDPVTLSAADARELAQHLLELAEQIG
ncbi:MAG: DUF6360 family protein [Opitutus sp.]|nr:DUF6360 family protein [Opitutus sp.]